MHTDLIGYGLPHLNRLFLELAEPHFDKIEVTLL